MGALEDGSYGVVLICTGEKYELAKKIKKIKLVNHRWLEDWYVIYEHYFFFIRKFE